MGSPSPPPVPDPALRPSGGPDDQNQDHASWRAARGNPPPSSQTLNARSSSPSATTTRIGGSECPRCASTVARAEFFKSSPSA